MRKKTTSPKTQTSDVGADDYTAQLIEDLKDPAEAAAYLEAALAEGDGQGLLVAMRHVAAAHGGMTTIAQQTGLTTMHGKLPSN